MAFSQHNPLKKEEESDKSFHYVDFSNQGPSLNSKAEFAADISATSHPQIRD